MFANAAYLALTAHTIHKSSDAATVRRSACCPAQRHKWADSVLKDALR